MMTYDFSARFFIFYSFLGLPCMQVLQMFTKLSLKNLITIFNLLLRCEIPHDLLYLRSTPRASSSILGGE